MKLRYTCFLLFLCLNTSAFGIDLMSCIPSDASFVIRIDFDKLNSKSDGMDYLKYLKGLVKDYDNYSYYDYEGYEKSCQLINLKAMLDAPADYGINMNSQAFVYKKRSQLYSGMTYLFKLTDAEKFQAKLNEVKCLEMTPYVTKQTENGKIYMSEKYVVGFTKEYAYIFVNDRGKFYIEEENMVTSDYSYYQYERNNENSYKDSIYLQESKAFRIQSDSLMYIKANQSDVSYYELTSEYANIENSIIERAKVRLKQRQEDALRKKLEKLMGDFETILAEQKNSIALDRNFSRISKDEYDVMVFINDPISYLGDILNPFSRRYSYYSKDELSVNKKVTRLYTTNISTAYTFNFDKGQVKFRTYNTFGNEAFAIVKKAYSKKQSPDLFKYIDATDLMAFASVSFNTKELMGFYEKLYFEYLNNSTMTKNEMNFPPAVELFWSFVDKDMLFGTCSDRKLFAVNGFIETKISYLSYEYDDNFERKEVMKDKIVKSPRMILALGIDNKDNARKLFDIIAKFTVFTKIKDNVIMMGANREFQLNLYFVMTEDAFILTNDYVLAVEKQSGFPKNKQMSKDLQKFILKHNFAMRIYTNKLFKAINDNFPTDSREMQKINEFANNLGDLTFFDQEPDNNLYTMEGTLSLTDSSVNSLQVLINLFEKI